MATLLLALAALALNVGATAVSATHSVVTGFALGGTLKFDLFGVYPDGGGFSPSIFFGGIVTFLLLAVAVALAAIARNNGSDPVPSAAHDAGSLPAARPSWTGPALPAAGAPAPAAWQQPPAARGWYPHPSGNGSLGYWDGVAWIDVPAPTS